MTEFEIDYNCQNLPKKFNSVFNELKKLEQKDVLPQLINQTIFYFLL